VKMEKNHHDADIEITRHGDGSPAEFIVANRDSFLAVALLKHERMLRKLAVEIPTTGNG
jgi:hypothetical protein